MSIVDADPTLPLALALALEPPAAALALAWLNVAIYRRQEQIEVSRSGEESEGKREAEETHRRMGDCSQQSSFPVAGDGERRRSCGRTPGQAVRRRLRAACVGVAGCGGL